MHQVTNFCINGISCCTAFKKDATILVVTFFDIYISFRRFKGEKFSSSCKSHEFNQVEGNDEFKIWPTNLWIMISKPIYTKVPSFEVHFKCALLPQKHFVQPTFQYCTHLSNSEDNYWGIRIQHFSLSCRTVVMFKWIWKH